MPSRLAFGLAAGLYVLLTVALTWPLLLHPGSRVPNDLGDSLLNMFILAWDARQVPFTPQWWHLPQFYPIAGAMAFSEHLLGLSLISTPIILTTGNVLLGYNAAFFLSFPLCAIGAHLLTYQISKRHDLALVAGLAYGFAPYRMAQFAHVQVLSSYWMPFALLGLHLFVQQPRWRYLALFAVSWYLQALACGYYLFYLSVLVGLWLVWFALGRVRWVDFGRLVAAWALATMAFIPIAYGYLTYSRTYGLARGPEEIQSFSADVASLFKAPANLRLWGWLDVVDRPESAIFPGLALVLVLAGGVILAWSAAAHGHVRRLRATRILIAIAVLFGVVAATPLWFGPWKVDLFGIRLLSVRTFQKPFSVAVLAAVIALVLHPSIRAGWARRSALAFYTLGAVAMWLLCLGPAPTLMNKPILYKAPYAWLMLLPGVEGVRVPARFWVLATLCLAVAGALALGYLAERWTRLRRPLVALVAVLVLVEAWPTALALPEPPAWRPSPGRAALRLEVPMGSVPDLFALYRATEHRRPVVNGYSGYFAPHYAAMQDLIGRRNPAAFRYLATLGDLEVVVNHDGDHDSGYRTFLAAQPGARLAGGGDGYSVYHLPKNDERLHVPQFTAPPLPIAVVTASTAEDRVGNMLDGNLISRWDTAGPQDATNVVVIDLGASRAVEGVDAAIGGFVADFPRGLAVDLSDDNLAWATVWEGETAALAYVAALEMPRIAPIRIPLGSRRARFIRLRQTSADRVYYWSIAELKVHGS